MPNTKGAPRASSRLAKITKKAPAKKPDLEADRKKEGRRFCYSCSLWHTALEVAKASKVTKLNTDRPRVCPVTKREIEYHSFYPSGLSHWSEA